MDDIVLNKTAIIERCIKRIEEEYQNNPKNLKIIERIIERHLKDLLEFKTEIVSI